MVFSLAYTLQHAFPSRFHSVTQFLSFAVQLFWNYWANLTIVIVSTYYREVRLILK
jgi:hypothetical protein